MTETDFSKLCSDFTGYTRGINFQKLDIFNEQEMDIICDILVSKMDSTLAGLMIALYKHLGNENYNAADKLKTYIMTYF